MSDNKLLAENTIRRFMKLANTDAFSDNFVNEMGYGSKPPAKADEEDKMEEAVVEEEETIEEAEEEEMEMDAELGAEDDMGDMDAEPEMDMDAEPEMGAADMSLTEEEAKLLISLGERLAAAMGGAEEAPAEEPEMDMDLGAEEEAPEDEEMMEEELDQDALVNEVLKRVTKRLVAEKLKNRK